MAIQLGTADQRALGRVLEAIDMEKDTASGFLAGFLEGLGEHLEGMGPDVRVSVTADRVPGPASSPSR